MTNHCTHIISHFESKKRSLLSRKSDGMVIAALAGQTVCWGEDPRRQEQRVFTDGIFAAKFLRMLADVDEAQRRGEPDVKASIEECEGESRLVAPSMFKGLQ